MSQKPAVGTGAFTAATATALIVAALLIIVGRWGLPEEAEPPMEPLPSSLPSGTVRGSPDAPITIVEFSDFQCHFCQEFATTTLRKLESTYIQTGKVRLLHRHYPESGEESMLAALASECAAEQGKFWPYYDRLMAARASPEEIDLTEDVLVDFARELGLDINQFNASLDSERYREKIIASQANRKKQEEKLKVEQEKFRLGRSTNLMVFQAQRDLIEAEVNEVTAIINQIKTFIDLHMVKGTLLEQWSLDVITPLSESL